MSDKNNDKGEKKKNKLKKNFWKSKNKLTYSTVGELNAAITVPKKTDEDWKLYFSEDTYKGDASIKRKLKSAESYLCRLGNIEYFKEVDDSKFFAVDIGDILKNDEFSKTWESFYSEIENTPQHVINLFGLSMERSIQKSGIRVEENFPTTKITPRFRGWKTFLPYQDLKGHNHGKMVSVIGTVVRSGEEKPLCTVMAFMCCKCSSKQVCVQANGCFTPPSRCITASCYSNNFKPLLNDAQTRTVAWKNVCLQELSTVNQEDNRMPLTVECKLTHDLTHFCNPGDVVIVTGVVDADPVKAPNADASMYYLHVNANSVISLKGKTIAGSKSKFSTEDMNAINKIHSQSNLFELVVTSLCPNIFGHELVKAGLVLALFSGTHVSDSPDHFDTRGNSHVLMVGDPGIGKSQMLLAAAKVSPRGVYVCGNSTTTTGLTVTLMKDKGGENTMEAGALVLADQGHCCIDEFDKMAHQQKGLLEAMEQQTISIAKSGVACTLPARTSILAAANPSGGHYNCAKTVMENLKIKESILSRFDLVFVMQDVPDKWKDNKMSEHMLALHRNTSQADLTNCSLNTSVSSSSASIERSLLQRLQAFHKRCKNTIVLRLLQTYISYARQSFQPSIPSDVGSVIQNFYLEMRRLYERNQNTPVTIRQLESLIRLVRARARVELRSSCTVTDAEEVIEIMKFAMQDSFADDYTMFKFDPPTQCKGKSARSRAKTLVTVLKKVSLTKDDKIFSLEELRDIAKRHNLDPGDLDDVLEIASESGFILRKGCNQFKLLS